MTNIKKIVSVTFVLLLVSLVLGCIGGTNTTKETETATPTTTQTVIETPQTNMPQADGLELYNYIIKVNNYKNWKMWPGKKEFYNGTQPHGKYLTTYVSDNAYSAITDKAGIMPDRSIIVKENYDINKTLTSTTVMYKIKGYDSENNDWFWMKVLPNNSIVVQGKGIGCINCHIANKDNDYLYTGAIK